ncbi:MAG: peptide ABC transporter substrate-binding protein [Pseudomonadota bacterium]
MLKRNPENGTLEPAAAERTTFSPDGHKITFYLRNDLFWSNGKKVTAEDYAYSLRRLLQPSQHGWLSDRLTLVKGGEEMREGMLLAPSQVGIDAKDETTLVLELKRPSSLFLDLFSEPGTGPVDRRAIERNKNGWAKPENWVGNGPFVPVSMDERGMVLAKNPHHRLAASIRIDEVRVTWVENGSSGVELYTNGSVDQFGLRDFGVPSNKVPRLAGRSDLLYEPDLRTVFLRLNAAKAPLSQVGLRQAMAMAIDRPLLLSSIGLSGESPAFSLIPSGIRGYEPPRGYLLSVLSAQKMIRDLGYCGKKKTEGACKPFPLLTLIHPESEQKRKIALTVETMLKRNLGIEGIVVTQKSPDEFVRLVSAGEYTMALDDLAVTPDRPFGFLEAFRTGRSTAGGFSSREFDQLLKEVEQSVEWNTARGFIRRAESTILRDGGIVPLFYATIPILISPAVTGYTPNLWDLHPFSDISLAP